MNTVHSRSDAFPSIIISVACGMTLALGMPSVEAQPADGPSPVPAVECRPRGGLPNFFAKAKAGGDVRVAYLGGSITAAPGWRVFSLDNVWYASAILLLGDLVPSDGTAN